MIAEVYVEYFQRRAHEAAIFTAGKMAKDASAQRCVKECVQAYRHGLGTLQIDMGCVKQVALLTFDAYRNAGGMVGARQWALMWKAHWI